MRGPGKNCCAGRGVTAIVPAAGSGKRFGGNKTFFSLMGRPVLARTLEHLQAAPDITEIIPALKDADRPHAEQIIERYGISKVRRIAAGGRERQDSVWSALQLVPPEAGAVLVHDGVRPFADSEFITRLLHAFFDMGPDGLIPGFTPLDTIKEIVKKDGSLVVKKTLDRQALIAVQTPQIFRYDILVKAYGAAFKKGFYSTDDSALVEKFCPGSNVRVIPGAAKNIKITTPGDIAFAEACLK